MNMYKLVISTLLKLSLALMVMGVYVFSVNGAAILSTDFTGRTVSGLTASDITWMTNGVTAPGDLTAVHVVSNDSGNLFNTAAAQGHFALDNNVGNGGQWSTSFSTNVTGEDIYLRDLRLDFSNFNNSGNSQTTNRSVTWTVTVEGSSSGVLGSASATSEKVAGGPHQLDIEFDSPITLSNSETYSVTILAEEGLGDSGNNTGIDSIILNSFTAAPLTDTAVTFANFDFTNGSVESLDLSTSWATTDLSNGSGVPLGTGTPGSPGQALALTFGDVAANLFDSLAQEDYYSFTVESAGDTAMTFSDLTFDFFKSLNAGANVQASLFASVEGFMLADVVDQVSLTGTGESGAFFNRSFDLSGLDSNITGPVEFRIYIDDAGATNQSNQFRLDNIALNGTIVANSAASMVPEPSAFILSTLGLLSMVWMRCRRKI